MQGVTVAQIPGAVNHNSATFPEAPVSINGRVVLPSTDVVQVTGRGLTGQEAAQRYKDGVEALTALYTPAPPRTREAILSEYLARGTLKALKHGDFQLVERLTKAFVVAVKGYVEPAAHAGKWAVRSQENPSTWYDVEGGTCSCPDWRKHSRGAAQVYRCKHVLAVCLEEKVQEELGA